MDLATAYLTAPERTDTGADWYDVLPLPDGRILVTIGSVAGHRRPGPTVAGPVRAVLRAYALEQPEPADLLTRLNRYLTTTIDDDTYMTALAALYHPGTATLRLANAGHPAPLLIDYDPAGGIPAVREMPTAHPPLGIRPEPGYRSRQVQLGPTTFLCAYTGGLIDAACIDRPGSHPELSDVVGAALKTAPARPRPTAQHLLDRILSSLLRSSSPGVVGDDIGLLVLARSG
jgi:serine phosphatase RsbU (regulator of sigma subunit)